MFYIGAIVGVLWGIVFTIKIDPGYKHRSKLGWGLFILLLVFLGFLVHDMWVLIPSVWIGS